MEMNEAAAEQAALEAKREQYRQAYRAVREFIDTEAGNRAKWLKGHRRSEALGEANAAMAALRVLGVAIGEVLEADQADMEQPGLF